MVLNDKDYSDFEPVSDQNPQEEYNPINFEEAWEILNELMIEDIKTYWSEKRFDLVLEWWNESTPTFEEMEEYFFTIIKEKYNWTYTPNPVDYKYRMEWPFDYFLSEVDPEVFWKHLNYQKEERRKEMKKYKDIKERHEKLEEVWFQGIPKTSDIYSGWYEKRLLEVLENNDIPNIPAIASQTTDIAKLDKKPDFYEQKLLDKLETYEKEAETKYITDSQLNEIENIFSSWHIDNPMLFFRFEELKKNNLINLQKRIFLFGLNDDKKVLYKTNTSPSKYLQDEDLEALSYFFNFYNWSLEKIWVSQEEFIEKTKNWFITERMRIRIEWWRFGTKYKWFYSKRLQDTFNISQETQIQRLDESERKFIQDYPNLIELMTWDNIIVLISRISENRDNILKWKDSFPDLNFDETKEKEKIVFWLENCIRQWIEKLKNKERVRKCKREERKHLNYKEQLALMINQIDKLYIELKKIEPQTDDSARQFQKESYKNEYIDFHRNNFIKNRISEVLKVDINDEEKLKEQIIQDVSVYFEKVCRKEIEKNITHPLTYNPLTNRNTIKLITESIFRTWHALLLKTKYPDDKERKLLRQELVQKITKNLLEKTEKEITEWEFSTISYCFMEPLTYLYKKYEWKEKNLIKNPKLVKIKFLKYSKSKLDKDINSVIENSRKLLETETNREQINDSYQEISKFAWLLSWNLYIFLEDYREELSKKHDKERREIKFKEIPFLKKNLEYNKKNNNKYTEDYIKKLWIFGYDLQDVEKLLDPEIQEKFIFMFEQAEELTPILCQKVIEQRLQENWQSWWKLQRIVQEAIIKEFWLTPIWAEQIEYLMNYLSKNLEDIFFKDLQIEIIKDFNPFRNNQDLLKKMLLDLLSNFKQNVSLWQWENMKMLWF